MKIKVAGAQIPVTTCVDSNRAKILAALDYASDSGADILLTPEGSLSGYTPKFDQAEVEAALEEIRSRAQNKGISLALGTCFVEESDGNCYNQIRFFSKQGEFLGFHSKILLCGSHDDPPVGEINDYSSSPLRTFELGEVTVGGLICNDLWANPGCTPTPDPHLSQQLAKMGAKVIFHAVNGGRDGSDWSKVNWEFHKSNLQMRARSGKVWIVTVDNCHPTDIPCAAPSGVIGPDGTWVEQTDPLGEQFFCYTITV